MLGKLSLEKIALLVLPYLLLLSVCYNSGYWDALSFSIFNYYEAQDILKDIAGPIFKFSGLVAVPMFLLLAVVVSWARSDVKATILHQEEEAVARYLKEHPDETCSAPADAQQVPTEQVPEEYKAPWTMKVLLFLLPAIVVTIIAVFVVGIVYTVVFYFFPYEEEGRFVWWYVKDLESTTIQRFFVLLFFPSIFTAAALQRIGIIHAQDRTKVLTVVSSFVLTLLIAYHYGKIDASKVLSGSEFRFWIDPAGHGHKYLTKINKHYFFLEDTLYINPSGNMNFSLDTIIFSPKISIITDDSLKSLNLDYYGQHTVRMSPLFPECFGSRNGGKRF